MERKHVDVIFLAVTFLLIVGVTLTDSPVPAQGSAIASPSVPYVELVSPANRAVIYKPVQTFSFKVRNVGYETGCDVLIDEKVAASLTSLPEQTAEAKVTLDQGLYKWKVQCKMLNQRTTSSPERSLVVESHKKLGEAFQVTGRVVQAPGLPVETSMIMTLVAIAGLVWALNLSSKKK